MPKVTSKSESRQRKFAERPEDAARLVRNSILDQLRLGVLEVIQEVFEEEKRELIGELWSRKEDGRPRSGGSEEGHVHLEGRRVPVTYPRIKGPDGSRAIPAYQSLRSFDLMSEDVLPKLVRGVSTRDYGGIVSQIVEGTGISKSTVSRAFVRASEKSLSRVNGRDLSKDEFVVLFFDGIHFGETVVVAALGVTRQGRKVLLGLQDGSTENAAVVKALLDNLIDRGLVLTEHFLAVIDGSKALRSALVERFGRRVAIARCRLHKKRNVLDHLPPKYQAEARRRISVAYGMKEYEEAKKVLLNTIGWLEGISEPAARSLEEGLEETLTIAKLELPEVLRRSFSTTNAVESFFDAVRYRTGRVKRWRSAKGKMVLRWAAAAGLEAEKRLRRIRGYKLMGVLIEKLGTNHVDEERKVG